MAIQHESVDAYIGSFAEDVQLRLRELREISRNCAPNATEGLKWGHPAYSLGTILFVFSGHQKHANFVFTPSTLAAFSDQLIGYKTGKGSIQLPYDAPVPTDVLSRMIAYRIREYEKDGVKWM
ncbi:iron chaperone [Arthrobacter crystallopoietes]|jgi:uncharacterized protein YdhG (YjbR/CyaY superfamily)|uniref:Uncharacterized conserved protein YdhG, YjbR/CyaY-like superfamily, DUF1801 family n=1 Tax=Crystallibacter crystallopoietes TaxID=37928 RepID=A0A1H1FAK0_9MICC|nr:DUF1801 domain-containing protein [Arthrobacter crystallopoietes]AUI49567.1 hypothetical protein AC20117_00810 [Arthrobacter crystallopoietes]SDQ97764.1 Uncharacterized conserved protein YdhG, YjbR/CyaY-like superfamily, DUF1801 family [Arthrobacter crystallopoietes]